MSNYQMEAWRTDGISAKEAPKLEPVLIEAVYGPAEGARATLSQGVLTVGSAEGCDLVLADSSISRKHVSLELLPGGVRIRDLGSRNGTLYMGARIFEARVPVGGSIRLGRATLRLMPASSRLAVSPHTELAGLVGQSLAMQHVFALIEKLGPQDGPVLIAGETGVGKGAVARALHTLSARANHPFVVFACAAVEPGRAEAELFGASRSAVGGERTGAVAEAEGGTLLVDDISALPQELQLKLLQLLEGKEYRRVGESSSRRSSVRILATTQKDLELETREGRFRTDLYYRLASSPLQLPPLRERPEDIALLAAHFARQLAGMQVTLSPSTLAALQCDPWRGNARELQAAVERVLALGRLPAEPPKATVPERTSFKEAREKLVDQFERDYLVALLSRFKGNVSAAAREAKLSRTHMLRLLEKHQIEA